MTCDTIDHVPARSIRKTLRELCPGRYTEVEVPACRECNCSFLGAEGFTVTQRKEIVKRKLERKYRRTLAHPHWTAEELAEMGPCMRQDIQSQEFLKAWVLQRLKW